MIVSTIRQFGLRLRADPEEIPFQYSANVQMKFEKDENYNDYTVVGYYIPPGENEAKLLSINDDGKFILGPDCFKQRGTLSFSFNLINSQEEVHLGSIDFEIRYAFGDSDTILPEPEEVWISLVTKVAEDAIKEDVELVKQKAKEASQSALTASEKANEALEYANNAKDASNSATTAAGQAITAKNDAITASNSASQFSDTAGKSAVSASDSANTAKTNANKTTEDRNEVERLVSGFDSHVVEKTIEFNQNATDKSGEFDSKVEQANTTINGKVSEATKQAQKAKEEANRATQATDEKLDKNLGAENSDKVLITDAEGNIVTQSKEDFEGGGTGNYNDLENKPQINGVELKGNKTSGDLKMYTQEEVDDLLDDKMDKPYVPIEITDSATLDDCLAGNFKIDKIKGNTYQKVETDILPTPSRPVPINSRKTLVTKANLNVFDLEKESDTSSIPDTGTYRSIGQYQLKANTKYIFEWTEATVPAKATLSFQIQDDKGTVLVSPFTYFNLQTDEKKEAGKEVEFTTNSSGIVKFAYNCTVGTSSTTETYQQYWYTKILKDIALKEDVEYESEYVELRSLKESVNVWDYNNVLGSEGDAIISNSWATSIYDVEDNIIQLKPNTKYTCQSIVEMVDSIDNSYTNYSYEKALRLYRKPDNEYGLPTVNLIMTGTNDILNNGETKTNKRIFTTPEDLRGCEILGYTERWIKEGSPSVSATVKFKNIMLVEGESAPSTYVAPTVRDYKIVDHTTQTSKIIRNVNQFELPTDFSWNDTDYYPNIIGNVIPEDKKGVYDTRVYNLINYTTEPYFGYSNTSGLYLGFSECDTYWGLNNSDEVNAFLTRIKEDGKPFLFQYQLAMPVEETITYVETDTSEVGYSWQDTTSPSPTIPAEVKGVEKIDILKTGKNLFDIKSHEFTTDLQNGKVLANRIVKVNDTTLRVQNPNVESYAVGDKFVVKANKPLIISFDVLEIIGTEQINVVFYKEIGSLLKSFEYKTIKIGTRFVIDTPITTQNNYVYIGFQSVGADSIVTISNILLEHASIATAYEPYTKQRVNYTPTNPMYSTQDGSIADYVDVEKGVEVYNMGTIVYDGSNDEMWSVYPLKKGFTIQLAKLKSGTAVKGWCDKFVVKDNITYETGIILGLNSNYLYIAGINDTIETVEDLKVWLAQNPITVIYPLATPTTLPIPKEDLKLLKSLKTEQGVTNIFVGGEVKPTVEARYPRDLALVQQQLEQKILLISDSLIDTQAKLLLQGGN